MTTKDESLIEKRSCGLVFIEVKVSNPNGDPDCDNRPRTINGDDYGLISPVCHKRRMRDMIEDHNGVVWKSVKKRLGLNDSNYHIWESALKGYNVSSPMEAKKKWEALIKGPDGNKPLFPRFWDMRVFGVTALETGNKEEKNKKENTALRFTSTGCVVVSPLVSLKPVNIISQTISKANPLEPEKMKKNQGTLAPLSFKVVEHGIYVGAYVINPAKAHLSNTTVKDIDIFKYLVCHAFSNSTSAFRSEVKEMQIIHADHSDPLCSFNETNFFKFCKPTFASAPDSPSINSEEYTFRTIDEIKKEFPNIKVEMLLDNVNG